jgi:hypothetical protein
MKNRIAVIGLLLGLTLLPAAGETPATDPGNFLELSEETGKVLHTTPEAERQRVKIPEKSPPQARVKRKERRKKISEITSGSPGQLTLPETPVFQNRFDWSKAPEASGENEEGEEIQEFRFRFRSFFLQKKKKDPLPTDTSRVSPW